MKISTYNQQAEKQNSISLPKEIFEISLNSDLIHQVAVSQTANRRKVIAHTKDRGEVSGGGRKPWRQKGTGRARHGSRRSPIWKGGGVAFGPTKERNFKKIIPKKIRRKALFMVLSQKLKDNELIVLNELKIENPKTKEIAEVINRQLLIVKGKIGESVLIALPDVNKNVILSARNIPKTTVIFAKDLNVLDLLNHKYLIMPEQSIEIIKTTFAANKSFSPKEKN